MCSHRARPNTPKRAQVCCLQLWSMPSSVISRLRSCIGLDLYCRCHFPTLQAAGSQKCLRCSEPRPCDSLHNQQPSMFPISLKLVRALPFHRYAHRHSQFGQATPAASAAEHGLTGRPRTAGRLAALDRLCVDELHDAALCDSLLELASKNDTGPEAVRASCSSQLHSLCVRDPTAATSVSLREVSCPSLQAPRTVQLQTRRGHPLKLQGSGGSHQPTA